MPVGKIQSIDLTDDGQADVTHEDHRRGLSPAAPRARRRSSARPRSRASPTATSTCSSRPADHQATIPAGGVIDQSDTTTAVDLDQLFNTFDPKTRKALSGVIRGYAASYAGKGAEANAGWAYLNPSLAASEPAVQGAQRRHARCSSASSSRVLEARRRPRHAPRRPRRPRRPPRHHDRRHRPPEAGAARPRSATCPASCAARTRRSSTCARRSTTSTPLVDESKPVAKKLRPFLAELRPLARDARPTLRDLSRARALARRRQRPHRADEVLRAAARRRRRRRPSATARSATARFPALDQGAAGGDPRARHGAALRARPHRLVRRLQPLRASTTRSAAPAARRRTSTSSRPSTACSSRCSTRSTQSEALQGRRPRWTSAGAARARSSAARPGSRRPTSPATRPQEPLGTVKRALAHPRSLVAGLGVVVHRVDGRGLERRDKGKYWVEFDNAFGLIQGGDLKVAGVRAGKITDIKLDKRTKHALVGFKIDKNGFGSLRTRRLLRVAPAVADRRVLRRLPARHGQAGAQARRDDPGRAHGLDRRARPRQRHPAPPLPRAPEPHRRRARRRRGGQRREPQRRDPPRQPGAARDRQGPRAPRRSRTRSSPTSTRQRRQGRRRPRRQPQGRRALGRRGQATPRRPRPSAAPTSPPASRELPGFLEQLQPTMKALGQVADDADARRCTTSTPRPSSSTTLLRPARAVRRGVAAGLPGRWARRRRPATARSRRRRPSIAQLDAVRRGHAGARQEPRRSSSSTSTTASTRSRRTRAARAARATPASRRCCSTSTTRRPRRRSTTRTTTSSRSAPFVGPCADYADERDAQEGPGRSSASAARASARSSPASTTPTSPARDARGRQGRAAPPSAPSGDHDLPLPAAPAPADAPAPRPPATPAGAVDPDAAERRRRPRRRRCRRRPSPACRPSTCRRCPASRPGGNDRGGSAPPAAAAAAQARARRRAATRRPRPSSSTTCSAMSAGRRPTPPIVANPVLVGAVTTLVVVVAVFLAYNANNGLPFVPDAPAQRDVSNGAEPRARATRSARAASASASSPTWSRCSCPTARSARSSRSSSTRRSARCPVDSKVVIRPRSALGLKYVELDTRHARRRSFADGGDAAGRARRRSRSSSTSSTTCSTSRRGAPSQDNLQGFGDALAGRGADLNQTIQVAPELFGHLELGHGATCPTRAPSCQRFFKELGDAARIVAPVSKTNARLFTTMADTFEAISRDPQALKDTISKSPPTLDAGTASLRVQRPFLEHTAALSRDLDAATTELRGALPTRQPRAARRHAGAAALGRSSTTTLQGALGALEDLVEAPTTNGVAARPDGHGRHAAAAAALPRPVRHGLQLLEHLLDASRPSTSRRPTTPASSQRALLNMATQHAGHRRHRLVGRQRVRPRHRARCPARADQYVHNNVYAPGHRRRRQRRLRRRPDRLHPGLQPAARQERQGRPLPGRRRPSASRSTGAPRPDLRAVRQGRQGRRPEPRPRARPARRSPTGPGGHGVDIPRAARHEAQAAQGHAAVRRRRCSRSRCSPS